MTRVRRAEVTLATLGIVVGIVGLVGARKLGFTQADGAVLFERTDDMIWGKLVQFSPLGAIVTMALASAALVGARIGRRAIVFVASAGFAVSSLQVIVQFGRDDNAFGARGGNLALALAMSVGLAALALADRYETEHLAGPAA